MKKSKIIFLLGIMMLILTGCTKQLKDSNGKVVKNKHDQTLTANIVCAPSNKKNLEIYNKTKDDLEKKYKEQLEKKEITEKQYEKKIKSIVDVNKLVSCKEFKVTSGGYEGIWNSIFIKPLSLLIIKIGELVKNYGLAVIITTLLIRGIMYPLTLKTAKQSENMKKAQPELTVLEKKYANKTDQDSMMKKSNEMMMIYKKYGINPMAGCLFSFIQIPLFFAFFESLNRLPVIFEDKLFFELAATPINGIGNGNWLFIILPILVAITTYLSFKLNSSMSIGNSQAKQMNMMMNIMLIMIVFMSLSMSTAIIFYWITNSTFTIVQNLIVKRSN